MTIKIAILHVDEEKLANEHPDSSFETEMGWVADSGIYLQDTITIPDEVADGSPIETAWILREIEEQIEALKEEKRITDVSQEDFIKIVQEIQNNYESIEQDMNWRICDVLGIPESN